MGLREVRYDLRHGAPRRVLEPAMQAWAHSLAPDDDVLEVGAGHYDHRPLFRQRLVRFDADPTQEPDIVGDAHAMPIEDASYDAVLAVALLEHVDDPYQVVREIHRILRPGGRVFAWVPFYVGVHGFPEDVTRFTAHGMRRLFELAGFEVSRVDESKYAGAFQNLSNTVHYVFPRTHPRRWVRVLNRVLFLAARAGFPLDRRFGLRLRRLYAGTELEARKAPTGA